MKDILIHIFSKIDFLGDDLKELTRLRLELGKYQAEDAVNALIWTVVRVVLALMAFFFGMIAASLGIGMWLGNAFFGFLATTVVLMFLLFMTLFLKPRLWRYQEKHEFWNKGKVGAFLNSEQSSLNSEQSSVSSEQLSETIEP